MIRLFSRDYLLAKDWYIRVVGAIANNCNSSDYLPKLEHRSYPPIYAHVRACVRVNFLQLIPSESRMTTQKSDKRERHIFRYKFFAEQEIANGLASE